jgi:hypothetical protein
MPIDIEVQKACEVVRQEMRGAIAEAKQQARAEAAKICETKFAEYEGLMSKAIQENREPAISYWHGCRDTAQILQELIESGGGA